MRHASRLATLLAALLLCSGPALAAFETGCCYCVPEEMATTSQVPPDPVAAIACELIVGEGFPAFVQECQGFNGSAGCTDEQPGVPCPTTLLTELAITCPAVAGAGAPVAAPWALTALVVGLAGWGWARLRRPAAGRGMERREQA